MKNRLPEVIVFAGPNGSGKNHHNPHGQNYWDLH